jgi:hypothetical protein
MYVRMDCSSKNLALYISSQAHVVLGALRMRDADFSISTLMKQSE